jgi:hypothetical protein
VRTEALYPSQAAAVLGLVQLFKDAILKFPKPGAPARSTGKKKKKKKKATKRRVRRARTSARRKPRKRARR